MTTINATFMSITTQAGGTKNTDSEGSGTDFAAYLDSCGKRQTKAQQADAGSGVDALLSYIQQIMFNTTDILTSIGDEKTTVSSASSISNPFATDDASGEGFITGDGPLPAFLAKVDKAYNLDATQQKALRDIALAHRDATKDPATIQAIADELAKAGIGVPQVST